MPMTASNDNFFDRVYAIARQIPYGKVTSYGAIAKALGREVKHFDPAVWEAASYAIVVEGNRHKFSQNQALKSYLINTNEKILVEASPADAIWGIGLPQDAKEALNPFEWRGNNLLGFALMEVRDLLNIKENESATKTYQ